MPGGSCETRVNWPRMYDRAGPGVVVVVHCVAASGETAVSEGRSLGNYCSWRDLVTIPHPDECSVCVLAGRSAGHNGGGHREAPVHRDQANAESDGRRSEEKCPLAV